jgi:hypothetical protein
MFPAASLADRFEHPPVLIRLRPCLGQGASLGEEAVLADSGRAGEISAKVGWVKKVDRFEHPCSVKAAGFFY